MNVERAVPLDLTLECPGTSSDFFISVSPGSQQKVYRQIADYTMEKYSQRRPKANAFLSGADGWIIAHAKCDGGTVVSHESRVDRSSMTPKIPNICTQFGVPCIGLAEMLTKLSFKFGK
jgi:hypothetical protein